MGFRSCQRACSGRRSRTGVSAADGLPVCRGGMVVLFGMAMLVASDSMRNAQGDDSLAAALAIEQTFAEVIAGAESGVVSIARRDTRADSEPQLWHRPFGRRPGQESI